MRRPLRFARHAVWLGAPLMVLLGVAPALSHHGWGSYDAAQALTVTGRIVESTYNNPHGTLRLEAQGKTWLVILAPPSRMQNRGLPADMMSPGATATVVGYPKRDDPAEMRAERITIAGKTTELR
jgi:hypothetical protein